MSDFPHLSLFQTFNCHMAHKTAQTSNGQHAMTYMDHTNWEPGGGW